MKLLARWERAGEFLIYPPDGPEYSEVALYSYGKVQLARHVQNGREIAVKVRNTIKPVRRWVYCFVFQVLQKDLMDEAELGRARREIAIMQKLKHPNICELYQVIQTDMRVGTTEFKTIENQGCGNGRPYVSTHGSWYWWRTIYIRVSERKIR